ncbi:class B sortase [Butyrivibrio sp. VCB2006]|uniref:class B sortase n=1 Tax=Butyrivibrio sp. VCB2006 TaxID=1280679 RepID=UPI000412823D|nr:class B sortase [Butyrivibrio sp. VCB2006]
MKRIKRASALLLAVILLSGCASDEIPTDVSTGDEADESFVDFDKLAVINSDIIAWVRIPGTMIDYPVLQSSEGDDDYYRTHDYAGKEDPKGAIYIEAANSADMCDFNEVFLGSAPADGTLFATLPQYLDRAFFDEHSFIHVYMNGNALMYYVFAAYERDNTRLLSQYDFSYATGCQDFIEEIFDSRTMNKVVRTDWEGQIIPENFLLTLSTVNPDTGKQMVVIGSLIGDVAGTIDRYVDYGDPEEY